MPIDYLNNYSYIKTIIYVKPFIGMMTNLLLGVRSGTAFSGKIMS